MTGSHGKPRRGKLSISAAVSAAEKKAFKARADECGLTESGLILATVFGTPPRPAVKARSAQVHLQLCHVLRDQMLRGEQVDRAQFDQLVKLGRELIAEARREHGE